jgi:DNA repair protein RecN (Recombination protein N)
MLISLSIKNYALIEDLKVNFQNKLSIITGETGAGKSILLGGLSLVLGKRADASLVYNKEKKCIIEAEFAIENYNLNLFFEQEDLDYESVTTIRREILPNGKSRAFINDTPTTLTVLTSLSDRLIDIHSQHETLQLADNNYQFKIIDALANNEEYLDSFSRGLSLYKNLTKELEITLSDQHKSQEEYDYNIFVLNELEQANLELDEQVELEEILDKLTHVEEIKLNLSEAIQITEGEDIGLRDLMSRFKNGINKIANYSESYMRLSERVNSLFIELNDIVQDIENENESLEYNPNELEKVENRLQTIYSLQKKHSVNSIVELLEIQQIFNNKIIEVDSASEIIEVKKIEINEILQKLEKLGTVIHERRAGAIPMFIKRLESILAVLEMKNTRLNIKLTKSENLLSNGKDRLEFLISANKGLTFDSLKKVASGGEMSRIMLAVKSILSKYINLPAIIFDEIDTGVSGEVSNKIVSVMQQMSENMQVITITHLPQIAAKGNQHYKVYKEEINNRVHSNIKLLDEDERIVALAEMLGGNNITESAIAHAKQLLA